MYTLGEKVCRRILSMTDLDTLLLCCQPLSHSFRIIADEEIVQRIEGVFAWFSDDVESMRDCVRATSSFVGGSLPLTLFSTIPFTPTNADLFVSTSRRHQLIYHLCFIEGYTVASVTEISPQSDLLPVSSFDDRVHIYGAGLRTMSSLNRPGGSVTIYTFDDPTPLPFSIDVITLSWSTALFNFVTADFAGCAYPTLTFKGRALFHMRRFYSGMPGSNSDHKLNTYCARGFEFAQHPSWWFEPMHLPCPKKWTCPLQPRTFGDGGSLVIPFEQRPGDQFGRQWLFGGVTEDVHGR